MSWRDSYPGNFLKAADLPKQGRRVKIGAIDEEILNADEHPKLVAELRGVDQRWVLNVTNCETLEEILGSDEPDDWLGRTVELFNDRAVRGPNGEKGGIRVREAADSKKDGKKARRQPHPVDDDEDLDADLEDLDDDD